MNTVEPNGCQVAVLDVIQDYQSLTYRTGGKTVIISEQEVNRLLAATPSNRKAARSVSMMNELRKLSTEQAEASASEIQHLRQVIKELPDLRVDRIAMLKSQVESGSYHVTSEDIADLIIRRALADDTSV